MAQKMIPPPAILSSVSYNESEMRLFSLQTPAGATAAQPALPPQLPQQPQPASALQGMKALHPGGRGHQHHPPPQHHATPSTNAAAQPTFIYQVSC